MGGLPHVGFTPESDRLLRCREATLCADTVAEVGDYSRQEAGGLLSALHFHPASAALDRLRSAQIGRWRWSNDKLCKPA